MPPSLSSDGHPLNPVSSPEGNRLLNRRHFRELLTRSEERIASNILADRLTRLEKAGLVSRRDDPSHKQKVIYSLTEASIALVPLLAQMGGCD